MVQGQSLGDVESPQRRATSYIAATALATPIAGRLPNITELREKVGVGTGTVQSALRLLQDSGAIRLDTQKRRGTFLVAKDAGALWRASDSGVLSIAMPLPSAWEFYGLSAGLQAEFDRIGVPISLVHTHGSDARLRLLERGPGIAVMSAFAAQQQASSEFITAAELPTGSYYAENSVVVLARRERNEVPHDARVGIDLDSIDHSSLTRAEFPDREYVSLSYAQLPVALRKGLIDIGVWHRTALWLSLDDQLLQVSPLVRPSAKKIARQTSSTAFVVRTKDAVSQGILQEISLERVLSTQSEFIDGL